MRCVRRLPRDGAAPADRAGRVAPRGAAGSTALAAAGVIAAVFAAATAPRGVAAAVEPPESAVQAAIREGAPAPGEPAPAGVPNPRRAWQNWTLNCQGCHRPDGTGSEATAPPLADTVSRFLTVPGGREYLGRVPGVATTPMGDADLAEVMNWIFWRFDRRHMPANFAPFTAEEIGRLRLRPLRLEAAQMHADLLKKADEAAYSRTSESARP